MKLFAKLLVLLLIAAMAGPFFIKGPDGQPLMRWDQFSQSVKGWFASSPASGGDVEVHRWQDAQGQWHYSDTAPQSGEGEVITVDPNVNVIQAPKRPAAPAPAESAAPTESASPQTTLPSPFNAIEETEKVREELEQRNKELLKRLDDTG